MVENYTVISKKGIPLDNLKEIYNLFFNLKVPNFYYGDNGEGLCCFVAKVLDSDQLSDNLENILEIFELKFSNDFDLEKDKFRTNGYCPVIFQ